MCKYSIHCWTWHYVLEQSHSEYFDYQLFFNPRIIHAIAPGNDEISREKVKYAVVALRFIFIQPFLMTGMARRQ